MSNLNLSVALTINPRTSPILEKRVPIEGVDYEATGLFPSVLFYRQLKFAEFDVSEMSLSSLIISTAQGPTPWVAIPVFSTRVFFHIDLIVRADAGIELPAQLRGRRMGVPEYQQTRAVWVRGALQHEFGVAPTDLHWFMERTPDRSHGGSTGFRPPAGVHLTYVPEDKDLGTMLLTGEIDAAVTHFHERTAVDRGLVDVRGRSEIRALFPDARAEARRYFQRTGIFPINHCVVIRRSILEKYPDLDLRIYRAFVSASEMAASEPGADLGHVYSPTMAYDPVTDGHLDTASYGIRKPRHVLETLSSYVFEQGLTDRRVALDEIFSPASLAL